MLTTDERHTATIPAPPSGHGLRLQPDLSARTLLDGGWWPRSADPAAELPGLILAIEERHGPITRIMLGRAGWDASRPRRLPCRRPGGQPRRAVGWFETMPAGLLTATARAGRTDLLTVPPHTGEPGRPGRHGPGRPGRQPHPHPCPAGRHHHGRHPGARQPPPRPAPNRTAFQLSTWEWEGGQDAPESQRAATSAAS